MIHYLQRDRLMCLANTSDQGSTGWYTVLHFNANESGYIEIQIVNKSWNFSMHYETIQMLIDDSVWTLTGELVGTQIKIPFSFASGNREFLEALMSGSYLTVENGVGSALATFSLSGSRGALEAWKMCWNRIWVG